MSYSIYRVERVKNPVNTKGIQKHIQRENGKEQYSNKDIDHTRTHLNYDLVNSENIQYKDKIDKVIEDGYNGNRKIRSDAIKHVDGIVTSDKAFFDRLPLQNQKQYFEDSLEFIKKEYGEKNVLYATVHLDEKTPHMHFGFVPMTEDGRLSAKDVLGNRKDLSRLQDRFNDHVNEKGYNLERGEKGTDSVHLNMQKFKEKTITEKINGLETVLSQKHDEKNKLEESIKTIQTELKGLEPFVEHSKQVDQIAFKEKGLIGPKTVKLDRADFESMRNLAKASETLRNENKALESQNANWEKQNQSLNKENRALSQENRGLKQENKFLKRTIDEVKLQFHDKIQSFSQKIGVIKSSILNQMGMQLLKRHFGDEKEIQGGQHYVNNMEKARQNENQEENELGR